MSSDTSRPTPTFFFPAKVPVRLASACGLGVDASLIRFDEGGDNRLPRSLSGQAPRLKSDGGLRSRPESTHDPGQPSLTRL